MSKAQQAALKSMERFVAEHGGSAEDIRMVDNSYRWTAPDGREAAIGWEQPR